MCVRARGWMVRFGGVLGWGVIGGMWMDGRWCTGVNGIGFWTAWLSGMFVRWVWGVEGWDSPGDYSSFGSSIGVGEFSCDMLNGKVGRYVEVSKSLSISNPATGVLLSK